MGKKTKPLTDIPLATWISFAAITVAAISLLVSVRGCLTTEKLSYLHVEPNVTAFLMRDDKSNMFVLKNDSPIRAVSLSVRFRSYVYIIPNGQYHIEMPASGSILDSPGENWIFEKTLEPNETISSRILTLPYGRGFHPESWVIVREFVVKDYRESDMSEYTKRAIFFVDETRIYSYEEALEVEQMHGPIAQLDDFIRLIEDSAVTPGRLMHPEVSKE
jgi:hypothetical protein